MVTHLIYVYNQLSELAVKYEDLGGIRGTPSAINLFFLVKYVIKLFINLNQISTDCETINIIYLLYMSLSKLSVIPV